MYTPLPGNTRTHYRTTIRRFPSMRGMRPAYLDRGLCLQKQDNHTKAMQDLSRAIELNPRYEKALINRGMNIFPRRVMRWRLWISNPRLWQTPKTLRPIMAGTGKPDAWATGRRFFRFYFALFISTRNQPHLL